MPVFILQVRTLPEVADPLIQLTRKNARLKWTDSNQRVFDLLKDALSSVSLLAYQDHHKQYDLNTDSSNSAIDVRLTQTRRSI